MTMANGGTHLEDTNVTRGEFEAVKADVRVLQTQTHSIDGGEQDLREQLRNLREEFKAERKANAEFRDVMLARVPSLFEKRGFTAIAAAIALAAIKMALQQAGVDVSHIPEVLP